MSSSQRNIIIGHNMELHENIHRIKQMMGVNESQNDTYTLYHGTSSNLLNDIISKPTRLFLTTDKDVATYYSAKGGENYFMMKEIEFENKYGETPDEYFNTKDNGEIEMFKSLYPKNSTPIVIEFYIPKNKINDINDFIGYKGGKLKVIPKYVSKIHNIEWDNLDY